MRKQKKVRPTHIYKERVGGTADFGKSYPDGSYTGTTYNLPDSAVMPDPQEILMKYYNNNTKTAFQYTPYSSGKEIFSATNFAAPAWNSVQHSKQFASFSYPYGFFFPSGHPSLNGILYGPYHSNWRTCRIGYDSPLLKAEASDFTRARAWATMQPRFESDFKALNFLFELKDFRDIGGNISNLLKAGSPLRKSLNNWANDKRTRKEKEDAAVKAEYYRRVKRYGNKNTMYNVPDRKGRPDITAGEAFSGGANSVASAWLLNSMAVQPLLKDLAAFSAAFATEYLDALEKFKSEGTEPNTRHYSELLLDETNIYADYSAASAYNPPGVQFRDDKYVRFTASLQYTYKYNLTDCMLAFSKYWGLTGTAEEFWNMLPFSFLLDYIFQVSKALKLAEFDKNLDLSVVNYAESYLSLTGNSMGFSPNAPFYNSGYVLDGAYYTHDGIYRPFIGYYRSHYVRTLTQPLKYGLILPLWKLPKVNQWYNIGALAKLLLF